MRRGLIIFIVLFLTGGATLLAARLASMLPFGSDPEETTAAGKPDAKPGATGASKPSGENAAKGDAAPAEQRVATLTEAQLDISRISPTGSSVFAGRAEPNTYVTVYENSTPVGSVKADENGEWSLVTEHRFASLEPNLTFKVGAAPPPVADAKSPEVVAKTDGGKLAADSSPEAVAKNLMSGFEKLVAQAREEAKAEAAKPPQAAADASIPTVDVPAVAPMASPSASSPSPASPAASSPPAEVKVSDAPKGEVAQAKPESRTAETKPASQVAAADSATTAKPAPAPESASIPVPIMFQYNEANFTSEGRRAADLLIEYLKLKHLQSISLSGHADERGSDPYNMDLSRERLEAVARYLRDGGFSGQLDLVPKGKSEPFSGVDRSKFSGEALYQLDRRVELRVYR
jgi:outer membrane protein OmpA-like peptidoglycan-associated protein